MKLLKDPDPSKLSAILMWLISRYFHHANFSFKGMNIFALVFLIIESLHNYYGINKLKLREIKTTISPFNQIKHHL